MAGALCALTLAFPVAAQSGPSLSVTYIVLLNQGSSFYGHLDHHVRILVNGTEAGEPTVVSVAFPFTLTGLSALPSGPGVNFTVGETQGGGTTVVNCTFPAGSGAFSIDVEGVDNGGSSVFFQNTAVVAPVTVTDSQPPYTPTSQEVLIPLAPGVQLQSVHPSQGGSTLVNSVGIPYLVMGAPGPGRNALVVYTSGDAFYFVVAGLVAAAVLAVAWPIIVRRRGVKGVRASLGRISGRAFKPKSPKPLLWVFVLIAMLVVFVPFVGGQATAPKVYLAATPATASAVGPYIQRAGFSYVTPAELTPAQFDSMSWMGSFYAVVIADYPPPLISGLGTSNDILVLTNYLPGPYVQHELESYSYATTDLSGPSQLPGALAGIPLTMGHDKLGFSISPTTASELMSIDGVLTLVLPFFAMAAIAGYLCDSGRRGVGGLLRAAAYPFMVFILVQVVYASSSVLLKLPTILYGSFTPSLTVVGSLGPLTSGTGAFFLASLFGFIFGVLFTQGTALKVDRLGLVLASCLGLAYLFLVGTGVLLASFATPVMNVLGSGVSDVYMASSGATLFFLCSVPLALFPRLGKTTSTVLLSFATAGASSFFIFSTDLTSGYGSVAAVAPGLALAAIAGLAFLGAGTVEALVRNQPLPIGLPHLSSPIRTQRSGES